MCYAMRSRADATSAEACRTFQNVAIHPSCHGLLKGWGAMAPDPAAELLFAVLPKAAVLLAAKHGLPWRSRISGPLRSCIRWRRRPWEPGCIVRTGVGLLHDLHSLGLHQAVDAHLTAGAGCDLPAGGLLEGVVGGDMGRPAGGRFEIDQPPFDVQHISRGPVH